MGVFKLGKMTFGSLFKKPETVLYPIETKPQPAGLKGHIAIDAAGCILCGMCDRSCSTDCIKVDKAARTWQIDRFQCVQCGYCITVCPKKCLTMDPNYAPASVEHTVDTVEVPEPAAKPKKAADKPAGDGKGADAGAARASDAKASVSAAPEDLAGQPATGQQEGAAEAPAMLDEALEAKIALMDPEAAEKVRAAIAAR